MNKILIRFAVILIVMFAFLLEIIVFKADRDGLLIQTKTKQDKTQQIETTIEPEKTTFIDMADNVSKPFTVGNKSIDKKTVSTESRSSYTGGVHRGPDGKMTYRGTQTITCKCNINFGENSHNEFTTTITQEYNSKPTVSDMDAGKKCREICTQFVEANE